MTDCSGAIPNMVVQCKTCENVYYDDADWVKNSKIIIQKRIWKQVRVPGSQYISVKSSVASGYDRVNFCGDLNNNCQTGTSLVWNQSSDRTQASNSNVSQINIVPSRGNSTKTSLTRHRPGAGSPGGIGVDIKHNSYDRYLSRKKTKHLLPQNCDLSCPTPIQGNKYKMFSLLSSNCIKC
jgi:hypothetical protein